MKKLWIVLALFSCLAFRPSEPKPALLDPEKELVLENKNITLGFDKKSGRLTHLINKMTGDNYLKNPSGGNLFRLFVNTKSMPVLAAGPHNETYGGSLIDPSDCTLTNYVFDRGPATKGKAEKLTLHMKSGEEMEIVVTVTLKDTASFFDLTLELLNKGIVSQSVYSSFPYFSGISLGSDPNTNLAVNNWDRGYPGSNAWKANSGGVYGRDVSMQWQCAYEPVLKEGLAFVTMDTLFKNKILTCCPGGIMHSLYFDKEILKPGGNHKWPAARVVVGNGNWRSAARVYQAWVNENLHSRQAPAWYTREVAMRGSSWAPPKEAVEKEKKSRGAGTMYSFEDLPKLFVGGYNDCLEIAQWNEGVNLWPETYGPWMSSGLLDFRSDLGGRAAFVKGVEKVHRYGRKVAMYVAGYGIRTTSPLFKGDDWKNWAIMKNAKQEIAFDYRGEKEDEIFGIAVCAGYKPWQDNIIRVCTMLASTGIDEIRLDEIGFPFRPCFNPAHHHESPYDCHRWMREYLRRIREAVDQINPNLVISTEFFMDYFHTYTNGALVMDCSGKEIDVMKVAMPSYLAMSYHAGSAEAAITGAILSKPDSRRTNWAWASVGTEQPDGYPAGPGPILFWHALYPLFADALVNATITEWDPVASDDPKWMGHLWKNKDYWVLTGGHDDATPLDSGGTTVRLPELPLQVTHAFEFDLQTLTRQERPIVRRQDGLFIHLRSPVAAVLFPLPTCPPLPLIEVLPDVLPRKQASSKVMRVNLQLFAPWNPSLIAKNRSSLAVDAPGFAVTRVKDDKQSASFEIVIPANTEPGNYFFRVGGNCLPAKKWFTGQ